MLPANKKNTSRPTYRYFAKHKCIAFHITLGIVRVRPTTFSEGKKVMCVQRTSAKRLQKRKNLTKFRKDIASGFKGLPHNTYDFFFPVLNSKNMR